MEEEKCHVIIKDQVAGIFTKGFSKIKKQLGMMSKAKLIGLLLGGKDHYQLSWNFLKPFRCLRRLDFSRVLQKLLEYGRVFQNVVNTKTC